jgi:CobQ-like glutamine amidotransferase family enzyme
MAESSVLIALVRPRLLGTYGDGGNAVVLRERLRWRGIAAEIIDVEGTDLVPRSSNLVLLGGGEDDAQRTVALDARLAASVRDAVGNGATVFGVCGGFQLLGASFTVQSSQRPVDGFGLLDVWSERLDDRAVGEVVAVATRTEVGISTGFENHAGSTWLGPGAEALGRLVRGVGNGDGASEGAVHDRVFGTYLHGPVLARNPKLADLLLRSVVGPLIPLEDRLADAVRDQRLAEALRGRRSRWWSLPRWRRAQRSRRSGRRLRSQEELG